MMRRILLTAHEMVPRSPGTHILDIDGLSQRYRVYDSGPVCIVQPRGPGLFWEPMRMLSAASKLGRERSLAGCQPVDIGEDEGGNVGQWAFERLHRPVIGKG
jgi:hypothetical protein